MDLFIIISGIPQVNLHPYGDNLDCLMKKKKKKTVEGLRTFRKLRKTTCFNLRHALLVVDCGTKNIGNYHVGLKVLCSLFA